MSSQGSTVRVVIIGAGIAGLTAALDLLHAEARGFDAAILHQFTAMMQTVPARSGRA